MKVRESSIRWRIQRWYTLLLTIMGVVMTAGIILYEVSSRKQRIVTDLTSSMTTLIPRLVPPPGPRHPRPPPPHARDPNFQPPRRPMGTFPPREGRERSGPPIEDIITTKNLYYIVWGRDKTVVKRSENAPKSPAYPSKDMRIAETLIERKGDYYVATHFLPGYTRVVIGYPIPNFNRSIWIFGVKVSLASAALVLIGGVVGWALLGRETRKISDIANTAERIANGNLSERIETSNSGTELSELANVLNNTFSRLERSFEQQVRFTADASHELRTPLTAILTRCQLALSKERTPEKYKESIANCLEAALHMKGMAESLLEVARIESGETNLNLQESSLQDIVAESIELVEPLAEKKFITIDTSLERFPITVDISRIQQVCINLISNAIKYSPPGSNIAISVSKNGNMARLVVADEGHGIPESDLMGVFDRFYRGENAYEQGEDSAGLGLAVAKAIVSAHHGSIQAANRSSGGALFQVELPLIHSPKPEESAV